MIHLFLTPTGDLKAFEKPLHIYSDAPKEEDSKMYRAALESAKASAVKVKNRDEAIKYLFNSNLGEWYESSWQFFHDMKDNKIYSLEGYKMEMDYDMCGHACDDYESHCWYRGCKNIVKLAIISPIEPLEDTGSKELLDKIEFIKGAFQCFVGYAGHDGLINFLKESKFQITRK